MDVDKKGLSVKVRGLVGELWRNIPLEIRQGIMANFGQAVASAAQSFFAWLLAKIRGLLGEDKTAPAAA